MLMATKKEVEKFFQTISALVIDGAMVLIKYSIKSFKAKQNEENLKYKKQKDGIENIVTADEVFEEIGDINDGE